MDGITGLTGLFNPENPVIPSNTLSDRITGWTGCHNPVNLVILSNILFRQDNRINRMEYQEVTEKIIGCAFRVYNQMGFGVLESVYEKCLMIELGQCGLNAEAQVPLTVRYQGEVVGEFVSDIVVEDSVIVELKSVRRVSQAHEAQLVNYLVATGKPVGLLLNFDEERVEVKRKVRELPGSSCSS